MQHLLRATSGPQAGAVYVLGQRTTIGRASDCDIQILHEGVSRHHAKITRQEDGSMVIADLSSDNGTYVGNERVGRHPLRPGEAVRIMRSRFTYEQEHDAEIVTSAIFRQKVTSGESLRKTVDHSRSLATIRAGLAKGAASSASEHSRARPQAVAPAPRRARPGAAAPGVASTGRDELGPAPGSTGTTVESAGLRWGAPSATDGGLGSRADSPDAGAGTGGPADTTEVRNASPGGRYPAGPWGSPTREARRPEGAGQGTAAVPRQSSPAAVYGSRGTRGITAAIGRDDGVGPNSSADRPDDGVGGPGRPGAPRSGPRKGRAGPRGAASRFDRGPSASPAGRMAPPAPVGVESEVSAVSSVAGARGSMGRGWVPVHRAASAPQSMRPGTTLAGLPHAGGVSIPADSTSIGVDSVVRSTPAAAAPFAESPAGTAEYGSMAPPPGLDSTPGFRPRRTESMVAEGPGRARSESSAAGSSIPIATDADRILERAATRSIRRAGATSIESALGSVTPTEEVPEVEGDLPRREPSGAGLPSPGMTTAPSSRPGPAGAAPPDPVPPVVDPARSHDPVGYEDTLRIKKPLLPDNARVEPASPPGLETTAGAPMLVESTGSSEAVASAGSGAAVGGTSPSSPRADDVPRPRKHVSTTELIDALAELLPEDDEMMVSLDSNDRPDARVHQRARGAVPDPGALLDAATADVMNSPELEGLSETDQDELRVQHARELADQAQRQQQGLECLVDILEYRELRLRALRGDPMDAERYGTLQERLQQRSVPGDTATMRRYHRYLCSIPAQLTHRDRGVVNTVSVEVEDLSAGGAKVTFGAYSIDTGEVVWLAFDLSGAERAGTSIPAGSSVVFKARVVWARAHDAQLGLIFAGAPRYGDDGLFDVEP